MFEFETLEGAMACFSQVGYVGQNNCIFYATTFVSGGGFVGGMQQAQNGRAWAGYLINANENGFGILPLDRTQHKLRVLIEDLTPRYDEFTYISYQQLAEVRIKRVGLNSKVKHVVIKIANAPQYDLTVMAKEKKLAYHEANFAKFCEFYSKK